MHDNSHYTYYISNWFADCQTPIALFTALGGDDFDSISPTLSPFLKERLDNKMVTHTIQLSLKNISLEIDFPLPDFWEMMIKQHTLDPKPSRRVSPELYESDFSNLLLCEIDVVLDVTKMGCLLTHVDDEWGQ